MFLFLIFITAIEVPALLLVHQYHRLITPVQDLPTQMVTMTMMMVTSQAIKMASIVIMVPDEERMTGSMVKVIPKAIMMLCKRIVIIRR